MFPHVDGVKVFEFVKSGFGSFPGVRERVSDNEGSGVSFGKSLRNDL